MLPVPDGPGPVFEGRLPVRDGRVEIRLADFRDAEAYVIEIDPAPRLLLLPWVADRAEVRSGSRD